MSIHNNPGAISDEEVERRMAEADGVIGAAGHQVTDPATRNLLRQKIRGEIPSDEYVKQVIRNGLGHAGPSQGQT